MSVVNFNGVYLGKISKKKRGSPSAGSIFMIHFPICARACHRGQLDFVWSLSACHPRLLVCKLHIGKLCPSSSFDSLLLVRFSKPGPSNTPKRLCKCSGNVPATPCRPAMQATPRKVPSDPQAKSLPKGS
jgi:hypothetical protein